MHICNFSSSLSYLPKKKRTDRLAVLACLKQSGRFSTFEIEGRLCSTMTWILQHSGWVETDHEKFGYPWTAIKLTKTGEAALATAELNTP